MRERPPDPTAVKMETIVVTAPPASTTFRTTATTLPGIPNSFARSATGAFVARRKKELA